MVGLGLKEELSLPQGGLGAIVKSWRILNEAATSLEGYGSHLEPGPKRKAPARGRGFVTLRGSSEVDHLHAVGVYLAGILPAVRAIPVKPCAVAVATPTDVQAQSILPVKPAVVRSLYAPPELISGVRRIVWLLAASCEMFALLNLIVITPLAALTVRSFTYLVGVKAPIPP